jgi:FMN phosphatase YigB (HAD superfamily)
MMKKVVLIDFDGVVLKNKIADAKVAKRAGIYTWKHINQHKSSQNCHRMVTLSQGEDVCYNLYKGYGHTVLGLQGIGLSECNIKDFNKNVYDTLDYHVLRKTNNNFDDVRKLINYCHECHYEMFLFSNAPLRWMSNMLKDDEDILFAMQDIRKRLEIDEDDERYLKPNQYIYDVIGSSFIKDNIVFVDDNINNIKPVMNKLTWTNIVMSTVNRKISNRLHIVDSLENVIDII